jgi:glycosyltransferase involved in cell wall biosynthesis
MIDVVRAPRKVTLIVPCYNEEEGIIAVIESLPLDRLARNGYELDILVVDNNSTDRTAEVARAAGARVIHEPKQGKGNAIRTGFYNIPEDSNYVVMLDGDNTYKAQEIIRLLEPLDSSFSDVIIGSRLGGKIKFGSMTSSHRMGNWIFSFLVRIFYRVNVTDVLTGYFAWKRETIVKLRPHLRSYGFAIEMEMITKMARMGYEIYSVPISYEPRSGESSLRAFHDGSRILLMFLRSVRWLPDMRRIAFVSDAVYPFNMGGKEKRLHEISTRLVRDNREVHIYTMRWWKGPKIIVRDGVYLHAISKYYPLYNNEHRSIKQAIMFALASFKLIFARFDVVDVDHIPFFPLLSMRIVCWIKRKKLYSSWHEVWGKEYWVRYLGGFEGRLGSMMERLSIRLPDLIIANSDHTAKRLFESGVKKPVKTIRLGVDLDAIFAAPNSTRTGDIIYVGRLLDHKNVDLLIKAVGIVKHDRPNISCLIVGDGPERQALETLASMLDLHDNLVFYNFLADSTELYGLMKASRALVQPSTREGFGLVVVEANACGLPVITTSHANNAAKDLIVEGQNGVLSEVNEADLAKQIIAVLDNPALHVIKSVQKELSQYHWNTITEQIEQVLR